LKITLGTDSMVLRFGKVDNGQIAVKLDGTEEIMQVPVALYDAFRNLFETAKTASAAAPAAVQGATGAASATPAPVVPVVPSGVASPSEKAK